MTEAAGKPSRRVENVWDYPRPPRLETVEHEVRIVHMGREVARASRSHRVLETSHPPVYYIPSDAVDTTLLRSSAARATWCEWKGQATYHDLVIGDEAVRAAAWSYPTPTQRFAALGGCYAFYPSRVDACWVDGELVTAQAGDFYGGWITSWISGGDRGFKGGPGTWGW